MGTPLISVAMTAYNSAPFVGEAVESLIAQTLGDFELLVVDDRSTDSTGTVLAEAAARDSRIRIVQCAQKGRVPALNQAVAEARAPWLAIMDSDDIAMPERFERQIAFLEANPGHGIVGSSAQVVGPNGKPVERPPLSRPQTHEDLAANLEDGVNLHHPSVIASTALVREAGSYRAPFRFAQDYDLFLRLSRRTRMANLPEALVSYRLHPGQVSTRHLVAQTLSAVVAWLSHCACRDGRPDPIAALQSLPPLGTLDALFDTTGADAYARRRIVDRILYAPEALAGDGYEALLGHIREAGPKPHLWRAAARLLRAGYPGQAARVGAALTVA